jgi:predicted NBD/HSP70 family sugar kinase
MMRLSERIVLQTLRTNGPTAQAALARMLHVKPQTLSLIVSRLEKDGLVLRLPSVRGRVGQPSVPIALNPNGAFSIGIKVGRRNLDALLIDFSGNIRERRIVEHAFPDPGRVFEDIGMLVERLRATLVRAQRARICGIGLAAPLSLDGWRDVLGFAPKVAKAWQRIDLRQRVASLEVCAQYRVEAVKDTAAACLAEFVQGRGGKMNSFLYIFIDTFIGGGVVINGHLYGGRSGNAGAVGSIALNSRGSKSAPNQLLDVASLWSLDLAYGNAGLAKGAWADRRALMSPWKSITHAWLKQSGRAIAHTINGAACLLDLDCVIIDGSFSREILTCLLDNVEGALKLHNWEGVSAPPVLAGRIGPDAQALGGALLPLYAKYSPEPSTPRPKSLPREALTTRLKTGSMHRS